MATLVIFILGVIMLNVAFVFQLRDYTALGNEAKFVTITNLGLKSNAFYSFAIGFLCIVVSDLYDNGSIPILWGDGSTQKFLSVVLLPILVVFFSALYVYNIHKMKMANSK